VDPPMIDSYIVRGRSRLLFDEAPGVSHQKNT
jgi:hypothetical protein